MYELKEQEKNELYVQYHEGFREFENSNFVTAERIFSNLLKEKQDQYLEKMIDYCKQQKSPILKWNETCISIE